MRFKGKYKLDAALDAGNFAEKMSEEDLLTLGSQLGHAIEQDKQSMSGWLAQSDEWTKLALQVHEKKSTPWPGAASVKYPLLTVASVQFHARAQQALLKGPEPVKAAIIGYDHGGNKKERADRVGKFMSYQVLHRIPDWEDDMDRMLMLLPFIGLSYKKTYMSNSRGMTASELVLPRDLIINYYARDFEKCRKTHQIPLSTNGLHSQMKRGFYLEVELDEPAQPDTGTEKAISKAEYTYEGDDVERIIWECHCEIDMDGDGYAEPWVVSMDRDTKRILRIATRIASDDAIETNAGGQIVEIKGENFFTRFIFMPDPNSKIYGIGLGTLLGPLNSAVNTLVNQLIDAGTLAVMPSGFLGRGIRNSRGGSMKFLPGEWKGIPSTGDDLRKSIFPLPVKEPSSVLFQLLGMLVESGQQVGSIADIMLGENPGQNQPYSTTVQVLEQGMKVFQGIYKRVYRSLSTEYKKIYTINRSMSVDEYNNILDPRAPMEATDFVEGEFDIVPASDPDMVVKGQKLLQAESLWAKVREGLQVNPTVATARILDAEEHHDIEELMQMPPPQPSFEMQFETKKHEDEMQLEYDKLGQQRPLTEADTIKALTQAKKNAAAADAEMPKLELSASRDAAAAYNQRKDIEVKEQMAKQKEKDGVRKATGQSG